MSTQTAKEINVQSAADDRNLDAPIYSWDASPRGKFTLSGAEASLPEHIADFQQTLRNFALNVARPIGIKLDRMTPEEAIAKDSPFWEFREKYLELGVTIEALGEMEPQEAALLFSILFEELGYGDAGLAISVGAGILPQWLCAKFGRTDLLEEFPDSMLGCWGITEPDHGSDMLDPSRSVVYPGSSYGRPNLVADLTGDDIILHGQKSAWVSNGVIADVCIIYCAADSGSGASATEGCALV
ncbi:MAG: acyl-CoA dehydrogenase, partial [Neolewinella sp.]